MYPARGGRLCLDRFSPLDKWSLCRLPLWCAVVGVARREGVARPE